MGLFDALLATTNDDEEVKIQHAPFAYIGSKYKSLRHILPLLPYKDTYVEVFGGSGIVLINRAKSNLDVYNDRFGGVVSFYRCVRDKEKLEKLIDKLEYAIMSKEDFYHCLETWQNCDDEIERAVRWYYTILYSFGHKGKAWGRAVNSRSKTTLLRGKLEILPVIHERFKDVQIENASWEKMLKDYDSPNTVFYLDPPYVGTSNDGYYFNMTNDDHKRMLDTIFQMEGFVALSGYENILYDSYDWDSRHTWELESHLSDRVFTESNKKAHLKGLTERSKVEEVLWIKEAR